MLGKFRMICAEIIKNVDENKFTRMLFVFRSVIFEKWKGMCSVFFSVSLSRSLLLHCVFVCESFSRQRSKCA